MKFIAEVKKENGLYSIRVTAPTQEDAVNNIKDKGYELVKIADASKNHLCRYCGSITGGTHDDLLCSECRQCFGHALYSEL